MRRDRTRPRAMLAAVILLASTPALAQEPPPAQSLEPKPRPEARSVRDSGEDAPAAPRPEPVAASAEEGEGEGDSLRELLREEDEVLAACLAALDRLGTSYVAANPVQEATDADCGIARPVTVTEIVPGVALAPKGVMRCATARALAEWVANAVRPVEAALGHGALVGLEHGSTYICRRRNNLPDGKLSEHGLGNAIDIMSFRFADGSDIPVMPRAREGSMEEAFQRAARGSACLYFTTVLGPGSDDYHDDHLHLDVKQRKSGYRLCQ